MRILVTGANGLVGSRVCDLLAQSSDSVTGIGRGPRRVSGSWPYEPGDLADAESVAEQFAAFRPEAVIHCASAADVDGCERDRDGAFADNVCVTGHVATAARKAGAHLVHASTDYLFDGTAGPYSEEDRTSPRGTYALTKQMAEQAVQILAGRWTIARLSAVYGWPGGRRANFGSWLVSTLKRGEQVRLFEDQFLSPSLALNVAEMLVELARRQLDGVWNICGAEVVNRVTFGQQLCRAFGFDPALIVPVKLDESQLLAPRPKQGGLRVTKALEALTAKPLSLNDSLQRFRREYDEANREGGST
jgi:dTDP-4-dehydrorhamnose reductase